MKGGIGHSKNKTMVNRAIKKVIFIAFLFLICLSGNDGSSFGYPPVMAKTTLFADTSEKRDQKGASTTSTKKNRNNNNKIVGIELERRIHEGRVDREHRLLRESQP